MTISLRNATARERRRLENADPTELDPCELGLRRQWDALSVHHTKGLTVAEYGRGARTRYRVYEGRLTRREVFYGQPSPLACVTAVTTPYGSRWVSDRDPYGPSWADADEALDHVIREALWDAC